MVCSGTGSEVVTSSAVVGLAGRDVVESTAVVEVVDVVVVVEVEVDSESSLVGGCSGGASGESS